MVKSGKSVRTSNLGEIGKPAVAVNTGKPYNNTGGRTAIQSLISAHVKYSGLCGEMYEWHNSGDVVLVCEDDVPFLLSKRLGAKACCGPQMGGSQVFQLFVE